ncbi:MAG: hypothetical protein WAN87_06360 [Thermoplasmata archaeon]
MRCLDATLLIDLQPGVSDAASLVRQWEREKIRIAVPIPAYVERLRGAYLRGEMGLAAALELAENLEVLPAEAAVGHGAARLGAN